MTEPTARARSRRLLGILTRTPATLVTLVILLVVGVVSRGLWEPFVESPGMDVWAFGLPAFDEGRWWTPVTGAFLVVEPWVYLPTLIGMAALGLLEYLRGWRVALGYFWIGQLFGVFGAALLLGGLRLFSGWAWAQEIAGSLDVGPSAGALACVAALVGIARAPWRTRGWMVLLTAIIVGVLIFGTVADLEDLVAVLLILVVDRTLRPQRATVREQRFVAFLGMLVFVAIEVILALVPTDGPFGATDPLDGNWWSTAIDVVVVIIIANGLLQARRWAWVIALILMSINVLSAIGLALLLPVIGDPELDADATLLGDVSLEIGAGFLSLLMLVYLFSVRGAFAGHRRMTIGANTEPTIDEVAALVRRSGGGTLSWMSTWENNDYFRSSTGIVAFQKRAGAVIALADPLGVEQGRARSVVEFIDAAEHAGLVPCFFSASEATRAAVPAGWRSLVVADDTIVDLPGLAFTGKAWNSVRTSMNKAAREGMTFRLARLHDVPWGVRAQLTAISEQWVGDKDLPEMRFTLGTLAEAEDPEVRIALAVDPHGTIDGFLSWLPIYGENGVRGWTLDLMRRREGGFGPVMEYLIASSAVAFRDEGAEIMSLSGAPLAHEYPSEATMISTLSARLSDGLEPVYGFQSLHRFKAKFQPRYETLYLLYRDEADLPRIGAGLTRAFLPDATTRQFARAGLELVRGAD
ncbi:bifunctional lysylphosphatidylglycerol flippase/synthetase MprF [Microbacterium dextranolyticum]|uniref:Phosphatidylglycerol lysyltransferase C-terminal domain-containing protein n=1 Tax=Microbacterium dextranolyticum TaxID=36806 RepID=A0A9W6HQ21_9MICO|nr:DUF2156 domain-containing protein [Microbacterium dextranolyticum]MBM7463665.1 lysylphosphatidylglycerol synthetase-like protein (DUF2156 family) [Microbacterium dextranolyticum]GLJ96504.1 hypothetical protein GCM10017591_25670 [Microbacterium dextranolyticum]